MQGPAELPTAVAVGKEREPQAGRTGLLVSALLRGPKASDRPPRQLSEWPRSPGGSQTGCTRVPALRQPWAPSEAAGGGFRFVRNLGDLQRNATAWSLFGERSAGCY